MKISIIKPRAEINEESARISLRISIRAQPVRQPSISEASWNTRSHSASFPAQNCSYFNNNYFFLFPFRFFSAFVFHALSLKNPQCLTPIRNQTKPDITEKIPVNHSIKSEQYLQSESRRDVSSPDGAGIQPLFYDLSCVICLLFSWARIRDSREYPDTICKTEVLYTAHPVSASKHTLFQPDRISGCFVHIKSGYRNP